MNIKRLENGNFEIDEETLKELLITRYKLNALECGGVDNWQHYCEALNDYIDGYEDFDAFAEAILENIKKG